MRIGLWRSMAALLPAGVALLLGGASVASASGGETEQAAAEQLARPNVIFILVDDLRWDGMGFLRPEIQTPNIDHLAANGTYIPNAVVTSSLCSPSRATILTGMTTRNHGVVDNNNSSEEGLVFFPHYMQQAGYRTGFFGKWHMGDATDDPREGFDRWVSFLGQGTYYPTDALSQAQIDAGVRQQLNVDGEHVDQAGYITDELTDYALDWLAEDDGSTQPFFLYLSHKAVHSDALPAPRHEGQYDHVDFLPPASMADTPENNRGRPLWVQNQRNSWHGVEFPYHSEVSIFDYQRQYYATLSAVDDSVGRILAWLRESGQEQNTVLVFYSDNGFLFGEHGLIDKRNAYQPSVRVPMIVYAPGMVPGGITNEAVIRNLDLAPTFLDIAGVDVPGQMEGSSFYDLVRGASSVEEWNPGDFVYEYYWEWTFPQTPTTFAIQRDGFKLIQYHGIWDLEELYDLENDPREMNNLIDDPDYTPIKAELRAALFAQLTNDRGEHVVPFTRRFTRGIVLRNPEGSHAADFPDQWYHVPSDANRYVEFQPDSPEKDRAMEENARAAQEDGGGED